MAKRDLHTDLSNGPVLAEDVVHLLGADLVRQVSTKYNAVHLGREPDLPRKRRQAASRIRAVANTEGKEDA